MSKSWKDVDCAGDSMIYHKLDIYLPEVQKEKYPVVIAIYGSAWMANNLKEGVMFSIGKSLLDAGFAVVCPNHRSSRDALFPAQIHDIKAVIKYVRANAGKYSLDTSFIGITGFSSGGHLASLAGTSGNVRQYKIGSATIDIEGNVGQYLNYSTKVDAVVDWFGPIDLLTIDSCRHEKIFDENNAPEVMLMGCPMLQNKEKYMLANPMTYIDANDPPFLIFHGDKDNLVPYCQSELLYSALNKSGVPTKYILVPGAGHGPGLFEDDYYKMMTDFFMENMKKKQNRNINQKLNYY
jgi:acetyl esterase/lipase